MMSNDGCSRRRRVALVLATISLTGCATVGSDPSKRAVCPPVVEYGREFQARAAEEGALLPPGSAVVHMLSDYVVLRTQASACRIRPTSVLPGRIGGGGT